MAYVAGALRIYATVIPQAGKEIVTGSGLSTLLSVASRVMIAGLTSCEDLLAFMEVTCFDSLP